MGRLLKHMLSLPQPRHPKGGTLFSLSFLESRRMQQLKLWGNSLKTWRSRRVLRAHHFGEGNTKSQGSHWRRLTFFVAAALLSSLTARRMEENKPLRNICVGQRNRQPVTPLFLGQKRWPSWQASPTIWENILWNFKSACRARLKLWTTPLQAWRSAANKGLSPQL